MQNKKTKSYICLFGAFFFIVFSTFLMMSCEDTPQKTETLPSLLKNAPGDSTLYGLACEGCNDSVVIILPYDLSDPLTIDVIQAWKKRKMFGMPETGDDIAVILSPDKKSAECVITIAKLLGSWCYKVVPTLHKPAAYTDEQFAKMKNEIMEKMPDSVRDSLFRPIEFGITLNSNKTISTVGLEQFKEDEENAAMKRVEYPKPKVYKEWNLWNGKLILRGRKGEKVDTVSFDLLRKDSLILHFPDNDRCFYRQKVETQDDNNEKTATK